MPASTSKPAWTPDSDKAPALVDFKQLFDLGASQAGPIGLPGFRPLVVVPDGYKTQPLDFEQPAPLLDYIRQSVTLADLDSFAAYVKRYQSPTTLIFAKVTTTGATFTAIFDYHRAKSDKLEKSDTQANRVAHRATYPCPRSHEWQQWSDNNGKAMSQEAFARFVDANMPDITSPDSALLLELILNFEAKSNVSFSSEVKPQSGARVLKYAESIEGTGNTSQGTMKVPELIGINVPIFYGGKRFPLQAKLFYRPSGGKLNISYELRRPHEVVDLAIKDIVADIKAETAIAPLLGEV